MLSPQLWNIRSPSAFVDFAAPLTEQGQSLISWLWQDSATPWVAPAVKYANRTAVSRVRAAVTHRGHHQLVTTARLISMTIF